jgi:hypothetical protein
MGIKTVGLAEYHQQTMVRAEPALHLGLDHFGQRFALTLSPNAVAGGRNGWFCFTSFFKFGGRNGWFC